MIITPKRRDARLAGLLALAVALLFIAQFDWRPAALAIEMEIRTDQATRFLVPYIAGGVEKGYVVKMVESVGHFTTVRFPVDEPVLEKFRLIQVDGDATVWLRNMRVGRFGGESIPIPAERFKPTGGIASLDREGDALVVRPQPGTTGTELSVKLRKRVVRKTLPQVLDWLLVASLAGVCLASAWIIRPRRADEAMPGETATARRPLAHYILATLTAVYVIASFIGLNGSSSTAWRFYADRHAPDDALLLGSTKHIRSDEWLVHTPWILSQAAQSPAFPIANRAVGDGPAPLITSLPVAHWSIAFRPQLLGFWILPTEQAFAFYWNFKWYALLAGSFLFLNLVASGRSLIALSGSCFIFFSGFIQWWFSSPTMMPEMVAMFFLALWAGAMIFRARSPAVALGAGVLLVYAIAQFVFCCYPRFQIPLAYLGLFVALGAFWRSRHKIPAARLVLAVAALAASGIVVWAWVAEVRPLLHEIGSLVYPGRLFSTGGTYTWFWHLAAFLEFNMTEHHFPKPLGNSSEASGFLFILPALLAAAIRDARYRRVDPLLLAPLAYLVLLVWFMSFGVPVWLAKWSGLWAVSSPRANLALGVGTAIALVRYLSREPLARDAGRPLARVVVLLGLTALLGSVFHLTNDKLEQFVSVSSVVAAAVFFGLLCLLVWQRSVAPACLLLVLPLLYAHGLTNPISHGLPGFTESAVLQSIRKTHQADPTARWLVLGRSSRSKLIPHLVKASGAEVLGGTRINPDREVIQALDPEGKYREVYSRYAEIKFVPGKDPEPVFELTSLAAYSVHLPLEGGWIQRLGVGYIVLVDLLPEETSIAGFEEIDAPVGCRILRAQSPSR